MMHVFAVMIFLGAFALSLATVYWMIAANREKIVAALLGQSGLETAPAAPGYTRRDRRIRVNSVNLFRNRAPQRLAA